MRPRHGATPSPRRLLPRLRSCRRRALRRLGGRDPRAVGDACEARPSPVGGCHAGSRNRLRDPGAAGGEALGARGRHRRERTGARLCPVQRRAQRRRRHRVPSRQPVRARRRRALRSGRGESAIRDLSRLDASRTATVVGRGIRFAADVVRRVPEVLAEGAFAHILASWAHAPRRRRRVVRTAS